MPRKFYLTFWGHSQPLAVVQFLISRSRTPHKALTWAESLFPRDLPVLIPAFSFPPPPTYFQQRKVPTSYLEGVPPLFEETRMRHRRTHPPWEQENRESWISSPLLAISLSPSPLRQPAACALSGRVAHSANSHTSIMPQPLALSLFLTSNFQEGNIIPQFPHSREKNMSKMSNGAKPPASLLMRTAQNSEAWLFSSQDKPRPPGRGQPLVYLPSFLR